MAEFDWKVFLKELGRWVFFVVCLVIIATLLTLSIKLFGEALVIAILIGLIILTIAFIVTVLTGGVK